jgi:uncharacterized BrkB/YihY/UPF0761 family membrane protein
MEKNSKSQRILTYILLAINLALLLYKLSARWEYSIGMIFGVILSIVVLFYIYKWLFKKINKEWSPINAALITYFVFFLLAG